MLGRLCLIGFGTMILLSTLIARDTRTAHADNPDCGLLVDCTMDGFYGDAGAGSGAWKIFKLSGKPGLSLHPTEGWPSGPSVWIQSTDQQFDAGIYQQVSVTAGLAYQLKIPFAVISLNGAHWHDGDQVDRRVGIDPYGGTDANSTNVQWSAPFLGMGRFQGDQLAVDSYAQGATITAFIRVINPYTDKHVDVYLDSPSLAVNDGMAPITVAAPTSTKAPATAVPPTTGPTRPPASVAPVDIATDITSDTVTPLPTSYNASAPDQVEPAKTAGPDATSIRSPTRLRRSTPSPSSTITDDTAVNTQALIVIGASGFAGIFLAGGLFTVALVYWLRSRRL